MTQKIQNKIVRDLLLYAILLSGVIWLIYTYQVLLGPLIISGMISYLLYPIVTWISNKTRIDRRVIIPLVYIAFIIILILIIVFIVPIIVSQFNILASNLSKLPDQVEHIQSILEDNMGFSIPLEAIIIEMETDFAQLLKPERIFRILRGASTNIVWLIIIFITSFHLLRDWPRLREWFFSFSPNHLEPDLRQLYQEIKTVWRAYLRGQLLIMSILGFLSGIGTALAGVPGALILGFLAGGLALIPNLGPMIATTIAAIVAWTQGSMYFDLPNLAVALIVVSVFILIQMAEGFWLTPRIMSRRLNLHPGFVLVAIIGTLFTLGALMALIIVPLLGSLDIILRYARRKRSGLDPWPVCEPQIVENPEGTGQEDE